MVSKRRTVGIDFGAWAVKAVELEGTTMRPILRNLGFAKLAPGVIDGGEWNHPEEILKSLAGLWWSEHLNTGRVVAGLSGAGIHIRRIRIEKVEEAQLRNRVIDEIKFYLPFDPATTALDFQIIDQGPDYTDLLVVTIRNDRIDRYLKLLTSFGLKPCALEVSAVGLFNLWDLNYPADRDSSLINIGSAMTQVVYVQNRKPRSVRTLLFGTKDCIARIQRQLGFDYARAEKTLAGERSSEEASSIVVDFAQELFEKLEADRKFLPEGSIAAPCYLSGGGSLLPQLVEYLEPRLNCVRFEPFRNIEIPSALAKKPEIERAPVFALAAGLALRGLCA